MIHPASLAGALLACALFTFTGSAHGSCVSRTVSTQQADLLVSHHGDLNAHAQWVDLGGLFRETATATVCSGVNKARQARLAAARGAAAALTARIAYQRHAIDPHHPNIASALRLLCSGPLAPGVRVYQVTASAATGLASPDRVTVAQRLSPIFRCPGVGKDAVSQLQDVSGVAAEAIDASPSLPSIEWRWEVAGEPLGHDPVLELKLRDALIELHATPQR